MCQSDPLFIDNFKPKKYFNAHNIYQRQKDFKTYYETMNDVMAIVT